MKRAPKPSTRAAQPRWIPPPSEVMKVNVDTALSKNSKIAVMAAVARSEHGLFLGASALVIEGVTDPEIAEAMAVREGLDLAHDLLGQRVRVASDCANAIRSIQGQGMGRYGAVVREIQSRRDSFVSLDFVHEHRSSNADAHNLARSCVYSSVGRQVWFLEPPFGLCNSLPVDD